MITIEQHQKVIFVTVFGEFTLADYKELEEQINYKVRFEGPVNLLIDLREMLGFTVDVAVEDIKFSRAHRHDFRRIAVLTASQWITWSAWITQIFVDAEVLVFEEEVEARAWVEASTESV